MDLQEIPQEKDLINQSVQNIVEQQKTGFIDGQGMIK